MVSALAPATSYSTQDSMRGRERAVGVHDAGMTQRELSPGSSLPKAPRVARPAAASSGARSTLRRTDGPMRTSQL